MARAFEDSAGDVWVACMYPAVSFVRWVAPIGRISYLWPGRELGHQWNSHLDSRAPSRRIWAITTQGFSRFHNGRFEPFPRAGDLPQPSDSRTDLGIKTVGVAIERNLFGDNRTRPTTLISPSRTFQICGSSSRLVRRRKRPTAVTHGSRRIYDRGPIPRVARGSPPDGAPVRRWRCAPSIETSRR